MITLGIDIGGSGIKGAPVDTEKGLLIEDRHRIATPDPSIPKAVAKVVAEIAGRFDWSGPVGCTFPAVIKKGISYTAANVDKSWLGFNGQKLFKKMTGCPVILMNDADAAGLAEMKFGAGKGRGGVVIMLTLGTGIGTAIFTDGHLVPNTEFGHMGVKGERAEVRAAARVRREQGLTWEKWAKRVNVYLQRMDALFSPDLFIIGGGVSRRHEKFFPWLKTRAEIVPARLQNQAGIIGAGLAAEKLPSG